MNGKAERPSRLYRRVMYEVIYEVLPADGKRSFFDVQMGAIRDEAAYFSCYVMSAWVKWMVSL